MFKKILCMLSVFLILPLVAAVSATASAEPTLDDYVLYADKAIRINGVADSEGNLGSNGRIGIKKGNCGTIFGSLHALDRVKNQGDITIDGDIITNNRLDDRGTLTVTGTITENANLARLDLPSSSVKARRFKGSGHSLRVPENGFQNLAAGSYGRVIVKNGAELVLSSGIYNFSGFVTRRSVTLTLDATDGPIIINVRNGLKFGQDFEMRFTGGGTNDIFFNYRGVERVRIKEGAALRGTLVAPSATVKFKRDAHLEGAVYAKRIWLAPGASFQPHTDVAENHAPTAEAGSNQVVYTGDTVDLDAGGSFDPDGDALTYEWSFTSTSIPEGSTAALSDPTGVNPTFVADLAGTYTVQLVVHDGELSSEPDIVEISAAVHVVTVPDVVDLAQADAEAAMVAAGLTVGAITTAYDDFIAAGNVISQNHAAGTSLEYGSAVDLVVSVGPPLPPPSVTLSAAPSTIRVGEQTLLDFQSTNADSAVIDHGVGDVAVSGDRSVSPKVTTTYTITVTGPGGTASAQTTVVVEDYLTFTNTTDALGNLSLTFTPDETSNFYGVCRESVTDFFTDPAGATVIPLGDDDSLAVHLTDGAQVSLFGVGYASFYVGSNGFLTFDYPDWDYDESLFDHLKVMRISALFNDLSPQNGGTVTWQQLSDRVVVTYRNVPEYENYNPNDFQIEMFFNGTIRLTYLTVSAPDGIVGLSDGIGMSTGFYESDISAYFSCTAP